MVNLFMGSAFADHWIVEDDAGVFWFVPNRPDGWKDRQRCQRPPLKMDACAAPEKDLVRLGVGMDLAEGGGQ